MAIELLTQHPLQDAALELASVLDRVDPAGWESIHPELAADLAGAFMGIASRAQAHAAAAARRAEADGVARRRGFSSAGAMLASAVGGDRAAGGQVARVGASVQAGSATDSAMLSGVVTPRHAGIIAAALDRLPESVTDEQRGLAERSLLRDAVTMSPPELEKRGRRIADQYAPEPVVDATEDEILAGREEQARLAARFSMWDREDGTWGFHGVLPDLEAAMLKAAVDGYASPRRTHRDAFTNLPVDDMTSHRLGLGFAELVSHLDPTGLPNHGGVNAQVVVTTTLESLTGKLQQAGAIVGGERVSAATARRLACTAGILPAVLGGQSEVLDLGREKRLFSPAQRKAIAIRDGGCTYPNCDRPPQWTEVHHFTNGGWAGTGQTNLDEGTLDCAFHHHLIEANGIQLRLAPDNVVEYLIEGRWRRNTRWRPTSPGPPTSRRPPDR